MSGHDISRSETHIRRPVRTASSAEVPVSPLYSIRDHVHTVSEECGLEEIASLLEDETARRILALTVQEPMSARTLTERCEASEPTVYRRLEDLRRCELLLERTQVDTDGGHHHKLYTTNLERIVVDLDEDGFRFHVDRREPMADRFTRLVEGM